MNNSKKLFMHLGADLPAGLVVFLVALPLCLGIALSSGAPLFSGIIAGVVGGLVIGFLSGSHTAVSGPAAGLTVIVLNAIEELQAFPLFLTAVFIAGIIQILLGILKAGIIGYYFPTSVIKGMLAGIGIILIIKQFPYAIGLREEIEFGTFIPFFGKSSLTPDTLNFWDGIGIGAVIIAAVSLAILIIWEKPFIKKMSFSRLIPGPLVVVVFGVAINEFFKNFIPEWYLATDFKVLLPEINSFEGFLSEFTFLDFAGFLNGDVWVVAITIAIIASLETLLSLEAADKIDPYKRISPPNRELFAQGVGNMINGLIGGMPVTAVIVRSSANIHAGGKTKMAAIFHGILLFGSVLLIPGLLNLIPLPSLAAILLVVGYKLAKISLFKTQASLGWDQFLPFIITVLGIIIFDLLIGIGLGMGVAIVYILLRNYQTSLVRQESGNDDSEMIHIVLPEEMSFLNKGALIKSLEEVPKGGHVLIDGTKSKVIDYDVLEVIANFKSKAKEKNIQLETTGIKPVKSSDSH